MLVQLAVACALIAATVAIQAVFMSAGLNGLQWLEVHRSSLVARKPTLITVGCVLFLIAPILIDVTMWALLYLVLGALPSFEEALYFSTVTFTTVGYGDITLSREWRQVATLEAINGWIIFGWATALIMTAIQRLNFHAYVGRQGGESTARQ